MVGFVIGFFAANQVFLRVKNLAILRRMKGKHQMQRDFMRIQSRFEICWYRAMTGAVLVTPLLGSG
jgi:hypothetical protein